MPDRPDNPIYGATPGASTGPKPRVDNVPIHQHLDTDALSAFIDNRLEGDLTLAAEGHIATCPDCRRELAELRATVSLLNGLPQYRPRRSFALGPDYAHPVRTSRFARLLPILPRLQAATVACLLLLLLVGAGDMLTQVGDDSNNSANVSSEQEQGGDDTAFQPDAAAGGPTSRLGEYLPETERAVRAAVSDSAEVQRLNRIPTPVFRLSRMKRRSTKLHQATHLDPTHPRNPQRKTEMPTSPATRSQCRPLPPQRTPTRPQPKKRAWARPQ